MKRLLSFAVAVLALAAAPVIATASQDTVRYGPINSGSTDSGTCGNFWADDTYKRKFEASTVPNSNGTYTVTESFIAGRFVTVEGASPGACNTTGAPGNGGTIRGGVTGTFNGTFTIFVSDGVFNPAATCDTGCETTADFVRTVYGSETYDVPSFEFTYHANGPLLEREWHNASLDLGGNSGDIRSS